jgi:N-acetylmuramoyl-L-alanine amidase
MLSRSVWPGGLIALALVVSRVVAAETPREVERLSPESARAISKLKESNANRAESPPSTPAPSTPMPMAYSPAVRPDGRHVVAIDIGHTVASPGATSARGEGEFNFNQRIAQQLFARLQKSSVVAPFLINPKGGRITLIDRPKLAAAKGAEFLISIHHDSANDRYLESWDPAGDGHLRKYSDRFRGYGIFISMKNRQADRSLHFARLFGNALKTRGFTFSPHHSEAIPGENRPIIDDTRGIYQYDDLIVLKHAPMPAVLVECGVIIHRAEELELEKPEVQNKIVEALATGIEAGFAHP